MTSHRKPPTMRAGTAVVRADAAHSALNAADNGGCELPDELGDRGTEPTSQDAGHLIAPRPCPSQ
jgi:hypothetical protein